MTKRVRTWWGEKFLDVLNVIMDSGRLRRGRAYAGPRRLLEFRIAGDTVIAKVRGNVNPYFGVYTEPRYRVEVKLRRFSAKDWSRITAEIGGNAACLSQLLMNEMPTAIEGVLAEQDIHLLPGSRSDIISKCSCPDYASPCKHVAGVYHRIASQLDRDPFLLFQLRGLDFTELQGRLKATPLGKALGERFGDNQPAIEFQPHRYTEPRRRPLPKGSLKSFWQGDGTLPPVEPEGSGGTVPAILIRRGGDFPAFWDRDMPLNEAMEPVYKRIVDGNKASL